MKRLLSCLLLLPSLAFAQEAPSTPPAPTPPSISGLPPATCPLRADEVYLSGEYSTVPAEGVEGKRTIHASIVDTTEKTVVSYVVHVQIALRADGSTYTPPEGPPKTQMVTRSWSGKLEPHTTAKEQWDVSLDPTAMGLRRLWFDKVTFADGSVWKKMPHDGCTFRATGHMVQTHHTP